MIFIKCDYCNGEGWLMDYIYYSSGRKSKKYDCGICNGRGRLVIIPDGFNTIRESEIKKD